MIIQGDARHLPLRDGCVQTVVTSPPYWGLRDYGHEGQIGLEPTPSAYVENICAVFAEVWRVLRDDGTCWINLGDTYAGGGRVGNPDESPFRKQATNHGSVTGATKNPWPVPAGLKPKDLVGIPWRVAFALQAAGWYLRSDIIWAKPNPMPESVTDRPTKAHEYLFLLSKAERYYYDADAIAEPVSGAMLAEVAQGYSGSGTKDYAGAGVQNPSSVKARIIERARLKGNAKTFRGGGAYTRGQSFDNDADVQRESHGNAPNPGLTRNKRSVWTVATQPYPEAHFATFPEALIEPCILAGAPLGGLVLDPFIGSGTTGVVCARLSRRWVGVDLTYQHLSSKRTAQRGLQFATA